MAASTKGKTADPADEATDLLAGIGAEPSEDDFADVDDLLNEVEEDDSEGWVPTEIGEGIAGIVVKLSETKSDFAPKGEDPMCPTWTVQTSDGTKWRVIGYGAVLKREMIDISPNVGDVVAIKYFGEKPVRKGPYAGKNYKHYGIAHRPKKP